MYVLPKTSTTASRTHIVNDTDKSTSKLTIRDSVSDCTVLSAINKELVSDVCVIKKKLEEK